MNTPATIPLLREPGQWRPCPARLQRWARCPRQVEAHIYTGIVGALLALIHTGHKYTSPLGIALIATMLLVVVSGIVLRYLTPFVNLDLQDNTRPMRGAAEKA